MNNFLEADRPGAAKKAEFASGKIIFSVILNKFTITLKTVVYVGF